jgi:hypothetical protein
MSQLLIARAPRCVLGLAVAAAAWLAPSAPPLLAQANDAGAHYTMTLIDMDAPTGQVATPVDITINRWSSDAERDQVVNAIVEAGQPKLLSVLQNLPPIGSIHLPGTVGWNLRYARHGGEQDGRDRIFILADRPVSFGELRDRPRSMDYPFAVIDLRIGSNDRGEGHLYFGAKVSVAPKTGALTIETYGIQPIMLNGVKREKK